MSRTLSRFGRRADLCRIKHVAWDDDDGDAGEIDCGEHGNLDHLAVIAALFEKILRMRLLEAVAVDFDTEDVRGNGEYGNPAAIAVEEAVDEVQVARTAARGAGGEGAGKVCVGPRGEGSNLLVAHAPIRWFRLCVKRQ